MVGDKEEYLPCEEKSFKDFISIHKNDFKDHIKQTQQMNKELLKHLK